MSTQTEQQLKELRQKIHEIRVVKGYCQTFQAECPAAIRATMSQFYAWLDKQEKKLINLGLRLKEGK